MGHDYGLHEAYKPANSLPAREVSDVNEGVVEGGEDVRDAKHQLAVPHLVLKQGVGGGHGGFGLLTFDNTPEVQGSLEPPPLLPSFPS